MIYLKYFNKYRRLFGRYFWSGIFMLAVTDCLDVIPPLIVMRGVDQITQGASIHDLLKTALLFAGVTLALAVVRYHWRMLFGRYHQYLANDLRGKVFKKYTELGPDFYTKNPVGELLSLMSNDIETIRMGMGPGILVLTDSLFYCLTIPPIMMRISVPLTIKCLAALPFLPFFIRWLSGIVHRRYLDVQNSFEALSGIAQENISGVRIVKSYVQERNQIGVFNSASAKWRDTNLKVAWAESFMHPVMEFCVTAGVVVLLYFGSKDVIGGTLTVGAFVAFRRYISQMVWPMTAVGWGFSLISQGRASLDRVHEFLETKPTVESQPTEHEPSSGSIHPIDLRGGIEIKNLSFKYLDAQKLALNDVTLTVVPGETLGIVGPVGSGKTTLAQLLCHLYPVARGQILVNGHDINDVSLAQLRRHISFVPQDTFLFSTSISENMAFGVESTPAAETLARVAEVAKLNHEIESLPQRYETFLGERGVNLSGGQKQRMAITRALLRKSPVLIFDDSLSAVDAETEALILHRLREETREHTTIIISHRLSTLSLCDKIVVLNDGKIESIGTPRELRESSVIYKELLELQGYA